MQHFTERNSSKHLYYQRYALADVCKIDIFIKISDRKAPVTDSVFNEVAGLQLKALLQKRPQQRCFPVYFVEYLRTPFL